MMQASRNNLWLSKLTKIDLYQLIEEVKAGNSDAIAKATLFVAHESFGLWHNRARAKLCRHFKNHPPARENCDQMIDAVIQRLIDGRFSEQFIDQLSMAIRLDPKRMHAAAIAALTSEKAYVRRYAEQVIHILNSSSKAQLH
ncbi:hypothetical protein [Synechococcus elongatus]|uniref:Uncharacterized protein n=1 Tax=Synechococcus elongatus PCC 11801 TaxID=2219813 RepID=A0AAN1UU42_SYNEL|nr:hypothetical protein [Synechococcus elongatus]AZB72249.1 hypothetical protein DOP62_05495 [Synechococcus elongatus PCC 11801]